LPFQKDKRAKPGNFPQINALLEIGEALGGKERFTFFSGSGRHKAFTRNVRVLKINCFIAIAKQNQLMHSVIVYLFIYLSVHDQKDR
jgi:hypothetical protein